ncbi:unnamed protein product [Onchocerca flexuosa]|uniref:Uncharacterized protein n=1 Tax=Onchocerca flexuosa TaxID=387005 RepID=A0A183HJK8_9BILA|nr:unnamed protein product [Onchocerca flexuosa]
MESGNEQVEYAREFTKFRILNSIEKRGTKKLFSVLPGFTVMSECEGTSIRLVDYVVIIEFDETQIR